MAASFTRWWVIAETGIRMSWKSAWLRRMLLVAWLPAAYLGIGFFAFERSMQYPEARHRLASFLNGIPKSSQVSGFLGGDPRIAGDDELNEARHEVWAWLLHTLFRYPQAVIMVLAVGLIAPPLIARDVRSRAFLMYFSRPLTRTEYIIGKAAVVCCYMLVIATLPALTLYTIGVLLSPNLGVLAHTWDLPLRILAASAVLTIPTTALALGISSLTTESRYAGFAWFAVWILGWTMHFCLSAYAPPDQGAPNSWSLLSLYHSLGLVQSWVFGFSIDTVEVSRSAILLVAVTAVSLVVLFRRVSSPMRV